MRRIKTQRTKRREKNIIDGSVNDDRVGELVSLKNTEDWNKENKEWT
jgi:hypothetical protein